MKEWNKMNKWDKKRGNSPTQTVMNELFQSIKNDNKAKPPITIDYFW